MKLSEFPNLRKTGLALALTASLPAVVCSEMVVDKMTNSTNETVAALGLAIEGNAFVWGNGSLDPTNPFTQAMNGNTDSLTRDSE